VIETGGIKLNVLQNLIEFYDCLPTDSTYREVARGILQNLEEASNATIYDIAEMTNSSRTTVWRMVQKMGYENYSDFKYALKQAVGNYIYYNRILPQNKNIQEEELIPEFIAQTKETVRIMKDAFSLADMKGVTKQLYEADHIAFYFPYQSSAVMSLQQNLAMSGKDTSYACLIPNMLETAKFLSAKSIVMIETIEYAETMDMTAVFEQLKQNNVTILMVSSKKSRYKKYIDETLVAVDSSKAVVSNLLLDEMYFFTLSELYRKLYI
jgi:DNA-binding MurR/RpiR family transcriptional regulator